MKMTLIISVLLIAGLVFASNLPVLGPSANGEPPVILNAPAPAESLILFHLQYDDGTSESGLGCGSAPTRHGVRFTPPPPPNWPLGVVALDYWINTNSYPSNMVAQLWKNYSVIPVDPPNNQQAVPGATGAWQTPTIAPVWGLGNYNDVMICLWLNIYSFYIGRDTNTQPSATRSYIQSPTCGGGAYQQWWLITNVGFPGDYLLRCTVDNTIPVELFSFSAN